LVDAAALASEAWEVRPQPEALARQWSSSLPPAVVLIARLAETADEPNGAILGVTTATLGEGTATSDETVVVPSMRGQGVATRLLDEMMALLRRAGVRTVFGQSSGAKPNELSFFLRYVFHIVAQQKARGLPGFRDGSLYYVTRLDLTTG
jgi:GNAT superfamily N-acetyltransferase